MLRSILALFLCFATAIPASALDYLVLRQDGEQKRVSGKVLVTAQDGGLLLMAPDGALWAVKPEELVKRSADESLFQPLDAGELTKKLKAELPPGFEVHQTRHYLILYNTSRAYAQWCGALYERLYAGFSNYWSRRGFKLREPESPLVALVFADARSYGQYAHQELGDAMSAVIAYYSLRTNRVSMYDLTGVEALRRVENRRSSPTQINMMLARPEAEPMVATVIHEATHQIAFNCGLQNRYADIPLWFSEGLAVFFETPDLTSDKGWRTIGEVNRPRLARFAEYARARPSNSLESLIADDRRVRDPRQALDGYAESWALTYFLIRQRPEEYLAYLKILSAKPPLVWDTPEQRLKDFRAVFGDDIKGLEADFLKYMQRLR